MTSGSTDRNLLAAQGYLELRMFEDALSELDLAEEDPALHLQVAVLRLETQMSRQAWQEALPCAELLCRLDPHEPHFSIHHAYVLRELGRLEDARRALIEGPDRLRDLGTYHYNLGCYEALLGNPEAALEHVARGFALDPSLHAFAQTDPDLASIRERLPAQP